MEPLGISKTRQILYLISAFVKPQGIEQRVVFWIKENIDLVKSIILAGRDKRNASSDIVSVIARNV